MIKTIVKYMQRFFTKEVILYLFFGVCTMVLNMLVYAVLYRHLHCSNVLSTAAAWLAAVLGAYVSNRLWVFESRASGWRATLREITMFFSCRIATGVMDVAVMYISVDVLHLNELVFKLLANAFVIIANYIASKLLIFKK